MVPQAGGEQELTRLRGAGRPSDFDSITEVEYSGSDVEAVVGLVYPVIEDGFEETGSTRLWRSPCGDTVQSVFLTRTHPADAP